MKKRRKKQNQGGWEGGKKEGMLEKEYFPFCHLHF